MTFKSCVIFTRAGKYLFYSQIIECEEADYRMGSTELSTDKRYNEAPHTPDGEDWLFIRKAGQTAMGAQVFGL